MGPEKRLPLALFLCFVILFGWRAITAPEPADGALTGTEPLTSEGVEVGGEPSTAAAASAAESARGNLEHRECTWKRLQTSSL